MIELHTVFVAVVLLTNLLIQFGTCYSAEWDESAFLNSFCPSERHVHLSTGKDASTSIIISFSSHPCDLPNQDEWKPFGSRYRDIPPAIGAVLIGTDPSFDSFRIVKGDGPVRYNATISQRKGDVDIYWSEYQHHIGIQDLEPDTTYYYKCLVVKDVEQRFQQQHRGSDKDDDEVEIKEEERTLENVQDSQTFQFRTAPNSASNSRTKVAILGDLGLFNHTKKTLALLSSQMDDIDSVVMLGDLSYANGKHRKWDQWFDMMDSTNIIRRKPLYIVSGNHDAEGDLDTGLMYQAFENRFRMPQVEKAIIGKVTKKQDVDLNKMYQLPYDFGSSFYSYSNGMTHNIVLNAFADFEPGSNQYNWLVQDLKVNRSIYPWVLVLVHSPIYNTFSQHQNDPQPINMKRYLEPLFIQHNVNFVMSGHLHAYSRSFPVANDELDPKGPIHIILGNGGRQANAPFKNEVPEDWVAKRDHTTYGYGTIEFISPRQALYEWVQTGHNGPHDKGNNFLNVPENITDVVSIQNQFFL